MHRRPHHRPFVRSSVPFLSGAALAALAALGASCSPAPLPPVAIVVASTTATAAAVAQPPAPALNLDPVPEPEGVSGVVRIGSPTRDLAMWSQLLPPHTAFGALAALGPAGLTELAVGSLVDHVDLAAALDMILVKGSSATFIASLPLRDLAEARRETAADFNFTERPDGVLGVAPKRGAKHGGMLARKQIVCEAWPGPALPAYRLVCADDAALIQAYAPYLTRTVARKPAAAGIRFESSETATRAALADLATSMKDDTASGSAENAAVKRVIETWGETLASDYSAADFDLNATPGGVLVGCDLRFRSLKSPFTLGFVGTRPAGTPPAFWKLPADTDVAFYAPGASPTAMRAATAPFWKELADHPPDAESPDTWRELMVTLSTVLFTGGPLILAHGIDTTRAEGGLTTFVQAEKRDKKILDRARSAAQGWLLVELAEPASTWVSATRALLKLDAKPNKKAAPAKATTAPSGSTTAAAAAPAKEPSRSLTTTKEIPIGAADKLPSGALHLVVHETPNPSYKPGKSKRDPLETSYDVHVFIVPDGDHTWLAISEDVALARATVRGVLAGSGATLAGRTDLAPLRAAPPGSIGFASLRGLIAMSTQDETTADLVTLEGKLRSLARLPSAGATPFFLSMVPTPSADGSGAVLRIDTVMPLTSALDLIQWIQ
jgi:hypothetical protein